MVDENTLGREPITIVEIDQSFCSLTYGSAPCTAAIGVTGSIKCYNTFSTCQDTTNFDSDILTLRFCTPCASFPALTEGAQYIPIVASVSTNPTELNIGAGNSNLSPLGRRASVTVTMKDIPYNDSLVDKYRTTRGFNPLDKSSFWVKFLQRNLYYQNRLLRVREGYVGQTVSSMRTRTYLIDKITGVNSDGRVTITAKDVLKLADDKRAQAPAASPGSLLADIDDIETTLTLSPTGIGSSDYPASGSIAIGSEVMTFTRVSDVMTVVRGQSNTVASSHATDDLVQLCLVYSAERVDDVIYDLLTTYGNIDASYITFTDWQTEADTWLVDAVVDTVITKPVGVNTLVSELCEQCAVYIWWDDVNQKIRFRATRPVSLDSIVDITSAANIIADSVSIDRAPDDRVSQVWTYYNQVDPTKSLDDISNFNLLRISANLDKEGVNQYNESRIRKIFSRWLSATGAAQTSTLGSRILTGFSDNPVYITCTLDAKDRTLDVADVVRFTHRSFVDDEGNEFPTLLQVISRHEVESGHKITYKLQLFGLIGNFSYIMPNGSVDFTSATDEEKRTGAYISDNAGLMSDGSEGYKIA
ncbi:MAG: hypothetical protein PHU14_12785 [Methylovulum sp.]|nr:hypothetical protein [Methylovulum sp.]